MSQKLTTGNPVRLIVLFTIPLLIGNICQQFYGFADAFIVGRALGIEALAAVGATGSIAFLLLGFAIGATGGFAIPVATRFGANDHDGVRRSVATGIVLTAVIAIVVTAISVPAARPLLQLLDTPAEIIDDSAIFLMVTFSGTGAIMAFNYLSAIIRALGDSRTPLVFLAVACVANIALAAVLVIPLNQGVAGAAWATVISQLVSVVLCVRLIARRIPALHLTRADWRISPADLGNQLRLGLPMGFQMSIIAMGGLSVQFALNDLGATAVAAFTAAQRVDVLAIAPLGSFGVAMSTFVAHNYGARAYDRIRTGVAQTCVLAAGFSAAVAVVTILTGRRLIGAFVGDAASDVVDMGHTYLVINGILYTCLGLLFVVRGALQGLGHTVVPTIAGVMELVGRMGAAVLLVPVYGFVGIAIAAPAAWIAALIPVAIAYRIEQRTLIAAQRDHDDLRREKLQVPLPRPGTIHSPVSVMHRIRRVPAGVRRAVAHRTRSRPPARATTRARESVRQ